ncbi:uncharacterized protein LOC127135833 [Lathyrus oleraceus]|uniref:uncharacterized protein LOC127135833 n=1 Tax=Pisum sativum TaxID=3888 RepID=UPI0021D38B22|nr:uncharacterized protein LOC127135833 [Pisum sativum]
MACIDAPEGLFGPHMLSEQAEHWWENTRQRLEVDVDACNHNEIEFLELEQGNISAADYATKFEEMSKYYPYYNGVNAEGSKCVNFENGLLPEIKQFIESQEICCFSVLVNKCRIYDEDNKARSTHYKSAYEKRSTNKNCGKPYVKPSSKEIQKAANDNGNSVGYSFYSEV